MKHFKALTHSKRPIITVLAENVKDAEMRIKTQLTANPSRRAYYPSWKSGGMMIMDESGAITKASQYLKMEGEI